MTRPPNLSDLQKVPASVEDVTALTLWREMLLFARVCEAKVNDAAAVGGGSMGRSLLQVVAAEYAATWGITLLLRRLIDTAPDAADAAARELFAAWDEGGNNMSQLLREWLVTGTDLDPEVIQKAYERDRDQDAKGRTLPEILEQLRGEQ